MGFWGCWNQSYMGETWDTGVNFLSDFTKKQFSFKIANIEIWKKISLNLSTYWKLWLGGTNFKLLTLQQKKKKNSFPT